MRILVSGGTATVSRLAGEYPGHLGHLVTPANGNRPDTLAATGLPIGADNGAFSGFDAVAFTRLLDRWAGVRLLWVCCPDVVGDAAATLALFPEWSGVIRGRGQPVAYVLQDGQEELPLPVADCYFVGGSTEWKLSRHAARLVAEGKRRGAWCHMGRVNTLKRLRIAYDMGCDSVDGKSWNVFGDRYLRWGLDYCQSLEQQPVMF